MRVQSIDDLFDESFQFVAVHRERGDQYDSISGGEGFSGLKLIADVLYGMWSGESGASEQELTEIIESPGLEDACEFFIACIRPDARASVQLSYSNHLELHEVMKELVQVVRSGLSLDL